jgi:hypothetical protein
LAYTSPSFDGSANVTAAGTLATVNTNVGSFTAANITVNAKGLITAAANGTAAAGGSNTQVQYNNAGVLAGITGATTNGIALTLVAPVLGTPASGTVTNLTGTASININGTVGATTPAAGAFTTLSATGITTVAAGSAALPAIVSTTGTADTGLWFPAADTVAASTAGAERLRINASGNVGIGTTDTSLFNAAGGTTRLAVCGSSASTDILGNTGASISIINTDTTANNTAGLHFARADTDDTPNYAGASIVAQFPETQVTGQYPKGLLAFLTSTSANAAPSEKMRIDSSGNVGIGTASPSYKLDVNGTLGVTGVATFTASPVIAAITNTGTLTLPTLTGTVGLATRTVQVFTSGSGTYTTPTGCKAISIRCVGGGGGGAASATNSGTGGGNSTFGAITANGGAGGGSGASVGGPGGDGGSTSGANVINGTGSSGGPGGKDTASAGGTGGGTFIGGAGKGGTYQLGGSAAAANTGAGGGGGGASVAAVNAAGGGGAGGYGESLISSPAATYSYAIGAGGAGGAAGTYAGGAGGSGIIIVMESY